MSSRARKLLNLVLGDDDTNKKFENKQESSDGGAILRKSNKQIKQAIELDHKNDNEKISCDNQNRGAEEISCDNNRFLGGEDDRMSITSSELNESDNLLSKEMEIIIGGILSSSDEDDSIANTRTTVHRNVTPRCVVDSDTNNSLFGGDFSDDDPSYKPVESSSDSNSSDDHNDRLRASRDLIKINNDTGMPSPELHPSSCRQEPVDIHPVNVSSEEPFYHPVGSERDYISDSDVDSNINLLSLTYLLSSNKNTDAGLESLPGPSLQPVDADSVSTSDFVSIIISEIFDMAWNQVKPINRWRTPNPDIWKRNIVKKRRNDGLPYVTNKTVRPAKVPKTIDCSKCMFKCTESFSSQDRESFCRFYWNLDFASKKNFILSHVNPQPPKRVVVERKRSRPYNTKCYFDNGTDRKQVCQKFFCGTLNIAPSVVKDAIKNRNSLGLYAKETDPRGCRDPLNRTSEARVEEVIDHINSFPTMESHYVRKQTKRKYLDCGLNILKMYALYLEKHKDNPVSEITFRRIFSKEFNLSFFVPKKDQCQTCNKYINATGQKKIDLENSYREHMSRKVVCTSEKNKDKKRAELDKDFVSVSFDLQAILQIPCSKIGILYFVRKLTVYNLCIYESALPNNAFCFPWSEVHGKKGSAEIGTILLHYLSKCVPSNVTEVSLFSDTCGGQNRNQYVTAILIWAVNTIENLQIIEQKFLESGHSYMEADSMHSSIESAKKHVDVFSITDWINIFKRARTRAFYYHEGRKVTKPPYEVKEFKFYDFFNLKVLGETIIKNKTIDNKGNKVNWLKIKRLRYVKDDNNIYFNYDMSTDFLSFNIRPVQSGPRLRKGNRRSNPNSVEPPSVEEFKLPTLQRLYANALPISAAKKKDLLSLCEKGVIPEEYHGWFQSLVCENIVDRVPDVAAGESSDE